jgi:hypothetical protein
VRGTGWRCAQEIRVSRSFFARCGIPRTSIRPLNRTIKAKGVIFTTEPCAALRATHSILHSPFNEMLRSVSGLSAKSRIAQASSTACAELSGVHSAGARPFRQQSTK